MADKEETKVCCACKGAVVGTFVTLPNSDKGFHPKCFNCAKCSIIFNNII